MTAKKNKMQLTIVLLVAFVGLIAGLFVFQNWQTTKTVDLRQFAGTILQSPREVSAFELEGTDGKAFNNAQLKGQWTMVFFGFTSCGSICPVTMAELASTYRLLKKAEVSPLPKVVMVSLDPKRDSLEKMKDYVTAYDVNFYGARGSLSVIKKMTKEMAVVFEKMVPPGKLPENYDIQHSGTIMLFNPEGRLAGFFTMPHKAKLLAKDYTLLLKNIPG